ncbi:MAG: GTP-binding protein [Candidatus Lokiarchaeota archaeon]|nr:GTP-binding protein [Candidatus Lokiarchaeota archaeon]
MGWKRYITLDKGARTDNIYKIVVLGDGFVGKTGITIRFCEGYFKEDYKCTIGVQFGTKKFRYKNFNYGLQLWDIAGQERFKIFRTSYYNGAVGAILVYDVTNRLTFLDLPNWVHELQEVVGPRPIVIAANKMDLPDSGLIDPRTNEPYRKEVSFKEGKYFADSINAMFLETSAKENYNIDNMFTFIVDGIDENMESFVFNIDTFDSVDIGFNALDQTLEENDKGKIYDVLIRLKQAIFSKNPYSIVLGNINEWIDYIPRMELNFKVKGLLYKSIDAWRYYYGQSLQEGVPVTSKI